MKYSNPLISTLLISAGLLNLVAPVLAEGTLANTDISNTATATYQDPTGATSNTTSNTVVVKVAEVAGINVTASPTVINMGATAPDNTTAAPAGSATAPLADNNLIFNFTLTNVGNDTTDFHIPNQAQTGSSPITVSKVQYFDKTAGTTGEWKDVDAVGLVTKDSITGLDILPGGVVKVRVLATVNAGTNSGAITVTLGNTGATNMQNDPFASTGGDVYTVDKLVAGTNETDGVPSNGVREAAATATSAVNPSKQAFVKVTKVAGAVNNNGSPLNILDDKVTYDLGLEVLGTAPTGTNLVAEDLAGTNINLDGAVVPRILVADTLPAGTTLTGAPVAPTGWTVVYTETAVGTNTANNAAVMWKTWATTAPGTISNVTRVGFVKSGTIAKGTASKVTGFLIEINLNLPATGGSVLNIAQAFGTTAVNGAPDPTKPAVDESGDDQANNLNPDGTTGPTPTTGVATGADGVDPSNTPANDGTGPGGESSIVTLSPVSTGTTAPIFNGPETKPMATGPSGLTNDDFTNKSVTIDATDAGWTNGAPNPVDPQSTGFTNTVQQDPTQPSATARPQFVSLIPTVPANPADLPNLTTVKIISNGVAAVYTYNYNPATNVGSFTADASTVLTTLTVPVTGAVNYGVEVDLPAGTSQLKAYPVSITSFSNGAPEVKDPSTGAVLFPLLVGDNAITTDDAKNITIDRLYTGFLKMQKEAKVYKVENGITTVISQFSSSAPKAAPGQFIEYRINYSNISEPVPTDSNSVGLAASNINILEKGTSTVAGGNNWATTTTHKPNTAQDPNGVLKFDGGSSTNASTAIAEYLDTIPTLAPGVSGQFTFTRQVK
jgi:hypothetical protein